jgi:hypothetical protein
MNNDTSFILGHLGLGDQIICNSIIRNTCNKNKIVFLPVKKHNLLNIKDLFKDIQNIKYIIVSDDHEMIQYYELTKNILNNVVKLGIFGNNFLKDNKSFDESFYEQANIDYNKRWIDFTYKNNVDKQISLFSEIKNKYIFVHDDQSRNYCINKEFITNKYDIYRPNHKLGDNNSYSIFDYTKILENAEEIHCMDSSFACYIDHLPNLKNKLKYIHRYVRKEGGPVYRNNWTILQ